MREILVADDRSNTNYGYHTLRAISSGVRVTTGPARLSLRARSYADNDLSFAPLPIEIDCARMRRWGLHGHRPLRRMSESRV